MSVTLSQIQELESLIDKVPARSREFARKLCSDFRRFGDLFPKKAEWVVRLIEQAKAGDQGVRETVEVGSMARVIALFDKAQTKGKSPAIVLAIKDDDGNIEEFRLSVATARAFAPGSVNVTDTRPYGSNTFFGRIYRDGRYEAKPGVRQPAGLLPLLERFAADPAKVATECGSLLNRCIFCNTQLTDQQRSTKVGFGETCAKRYGLHEEWKAAKKQAAFATETKDAQQQAA